MIKAVIFDLGGVYFTDGTKIAMERISKRYGLNHDSVVQILKTGSELGQAYRRGQITADEFWKKFKSSFGINADNKELTEIWVGSYEVINDTLDIIKFLKKNGINVYYLSDNVKERVDILEPDFAT